MGLVPSKGLSRQKHSPPDNMTFPPRSHIVEVKNQLPQVSFEFNMFTI